MPYTVTARFNSNTAAEFHRLLTDGTIESQKPDGKEIVAAMKRAKIDEAEIVRWSELCYCTTPLEHERATVYDRFFDDIETKEIDGQREFEGEDFMEYLGRLTG
jgi:predicted HAD superfamily Cof-like phosphohydrolase